MYIREAFVQRLIFKGYWTCHSRNLYRNSGLLSSQCKFFKSHISNHVLTIMTSGEFFYATRIVIFNLLSYQSLHLSTEWQLIISDALKDVSNIPVQLCICIWGSRCSDKSSFSNMIQNKY